MPHAAAADATLLLRHDADGDVDAAQRVLMLPGMPLTLRYVDASAYAFSAAAMILRAFDAVDAATLPPPYLPLRRFVLICCLRYHAMLVDTTRCQLPMMLRFRCCRHGAMIIDYGAPPMLLPLRIMNRRRMFAYQQYAAAAAYDAAAAF